MKDKEFLKGSIFDKPFMRSRVTSEEMTLKEKILGYLLGPCGMMIFIALINQLRELYLTSVFYVDKIYGVGTYLVIVWIIRIVGIFSGLLLGWFVEHTVCSQGKIRPYVLIGSLLSIISGFCIFAIPNIGKTGQLIWFIFFSVVYDCFGIAAYNLRVKNLTLATRKQEDRNLIGTFTNVGNYLISGVFVGLMVSSVFYYMFLVDDMIGTNWIIMVGIGALIALPLVFVEYFYTKERLTLETEEEVKTHLSLKEQLKAIATNKYWILSTLFVSINVISTTIRGQNITTNFCQTILGANAQNNYQLWFTILSGLPLGLGIFIIYPLAKKLTIRKTTIIFNIIFIVGAIISLINPYSFIITAIGGFIMNVGTLANMYIMGVLAYTCNDAIEYEHDFRPESTMANQILTVIVGIITGIFAGVYETGLSATGYDITLGVNQPLAVQKWIIFVMFWVQIIAYVLITICIYFYDLEKDLPRIQVEIAQRHKEKETNE